MHQTMRFKNVFIFVIRMICVLNIISSESLYADTLTRLQVANIIDHVGFPPPLVPIMTCISQHESSFRTSILNHNTNNTIDYGVMQVNTIWLSRCHATEQSILNPYINVNCAYLVFQEQGLTAWVTFNKFRDICMSFQVPGFKLPDTEKVYTVIDNSEFI